ncbi:MAG: hypothetical protein ACRELA_19395 [Candidatus Rokuibacteriota bacterium]
MKIAVGTTGALAAAAAAGLPLRPRAIYRWLASPTLSGARPGLLADSTVETLLATTEALAGLPVERGHHADVFRWRAQHLSGYRALYERFEATADRLAQEAGGRSFAATAPPARLTLLEDAFRVRGAVSRIERVRLGMVDRDWVLFERLHRAGHPGPLRRDGWVGPLGV